MWKEKLDPFLKRFDVYFSILLTWLEKPLHTASQKALEEIPPYPLTYPVVERYADLRRFMRQPYGQGLIGDMDTLIAATALENNLMLITTNRRDFEQVPGLHV